MYILNKFNLFMVKDLQVVYIILLIIVFTFIQTHANAQLFHLDGFWNLEFKDSRALCQSKIKTKYGYKPAQVDPSGNTIVYKQIKFGGNNCDGIVLGFMQDKLFLGKIVIRPETPQGLLDVYRGLTNDINIKYHQPNESVFKLLYPYKESDSDGEVLLAISAGYATINNVWLFDGDNGYKNSIVAEVNKDGYIVLTYAYGPLYSIFQQIRENKARSDY